MIRFAVEFEVRGINDPCAGSPGNHLLSFSPGDLEIIIKKSSRIDWKGFPAFAQVLDREIGKVDFLICAKFHTRSVGRILFSMSAAHHNFKGKYRAGHESKTRAICHT